MAVTSFRGMKWTDRGWEALRKRVTSGPAVNHAAVGVVGSDASRPHPLRDGDLSIEEVALLNEFGNSNQPERSFLRRTFNWDKSNARELKHHLAQASREVMFRSKSWGTALVSVGEWGVKKIQATIMSNVGPANAQSTIDDKGKGTTLRHTMTLFNAISYIINGPKGK